MEEHRGFTDNCTKPKKYFAKIDAYVTGTVDPGLLIIDGRVAEGVPNEVAIESVWEELVTLKNTKLTDHELQKIKNQVTSAIEFSEINILNKAMNLAYYAAIGDIDLINNQREKYEAVTAEDLINAANQIFKRENSNTLIYGPN